MKDSAESLARRSQVGVLSQRCSRTRRGEDPPNLKLAFPTGKVRAQPIEASQWSMRSVRAEAEANLWKKKSGNRPLNTEAR